MVSCKASATAPSKLDGRLRAINRASAEVNAHRAEFCGGVRVTSQSVLNSLDLATSRESLDSDVSIKSDLKQIGRLKKGRGARDAVKDEIELDVFGYLKDEKSPFSHRSLTGRRGRIITLRGTPEQLDDAAADPNLLLLQLANTIKPPSPRNEAVASSRTTVEISEEAAVGIRAEHILVGILDVAGFDFGHEDFLDDKGNTRFVAIWDQGDDTFKPPAGRDYGSVLTDEHLKFAMQRSGHAGLPATEIMPQSQMERGSHATHVASIAAGNSSIANRAMIAGVLISLPRKDLDPRLSFYDTTRIVHAVEFLFDLAENLRAKGTRVDGVAINVSLGTNGGPHDDSSPMSRWIDYALTEPGRCVCVAAGNAGQEAPRNERDIGHMLGRIHTSGQIASTGLANHLEWIVVGDGIEDTSENELEIWYQPQDRISAQVKPPGGDWLPAIEPGTFMQNIKLEDGTFVSIYNELYDPSNGLNRISFYLTPLMVRDRIVGVTPGLWTVKLIGTEIRNGTYDGWIERDDPVHRGNLAGTSIWRFPSFFAEGTNVNDSSISTLACGDRVIAVANLDEAGQAINVTSSQGPTRDGRYKPDIAAAGTAIWAANGFDPDAPWVAKTGTSMAAPFVTSVAACMISINPNLTASQILGIVRRTANPLPDCDYSWRNDAGFGAISAADCLREAAAARYVFEIDPEAGK